MSRQYSLYNSGHQPAHTRQMPAGAPCSFPTLVPRGEPHCECLLVVPGLISVWSLTACGSPRPEFTSLPILSIFSESPTYLGSDLFLLSTFVHLAMCQYSQHPVPCAALTRKDIPVLHWEGTAHTARREERNWSMCSRGTASLGLLLGSDTAAWGKSALPKMLGVILGGLLEGYPSTDEVPLSAAVDSLCDTPECVWPLGSRYTGGAGQS